MNNKLCWKKILERFRLNRPRDIQMCTWHSIAALTIEETEQLRQGWWWNLRNDCKAMRMKGNECNEFLMAIKERLENNVALAAQRGGGELKYMSNQLLNQNSKFLVRFYYSYNYLHIFSFENDSSPRPAIIDLVFAVRKRESARWWFHRGFDQHFLARRERQRRVEKMIWYKNFKKQIIRTHWPMGESPSFSPGGEPPETESLSIE